MLFFDTAGCSGVVQQKERSFMTSGIATFGAKAPIGHVLCPACAFSWWPWL
jgi:hypothetical protein